MTAAVGAATFILGSVLYAAVNGAAASLIDIGLAVIGPPLLSWVALVLALGLLWRRATPASFAAAAVALALLATILGAAMTSGLGGLLGFPWFFLWQAAGLAGAALIGALAGYGVRTRGQNSRVTVLGVIALVLLACGAVCAFALPWQWVDVYFRIDGQAVEVSPADADRYLWTAGSALVLLTASFVVALIRWRPGLAWLTGIALVLALLAAFVLQVPQGRFAPGQDTPEPYNTDYRPCYGTSGYCPGG